MHTDWLDMNEREIFPWSTSCNLNISKNFDNSHTKPQEYYTTDNSSKSESSLDGNTHGLKVHQLVFVQMYETVAKTTNTVKGMYRVRNGNVLRLLKLAPLNVDGI